MSLNESIVEEAALEWFGEHSRFAPTLTPALSHGEREKREAIRRLNSANLSCVFAPLRNALPLQPPSLELSLAKFTGSREASV